MKQLFPEAQVTIGPVIEDGFYYDFAYKRPFTTEDLAAIEARMTSWPRPIRRSPAGSCSRDEAVEYFTSLGENYKAEIIASIPAGGANQPLRTGRLGRPVPRAARALNRANSRPSSS